MRPEIKFIPLKRFYEEKDSQMEKFMERFSWFVIGASSLMIIRAIGCLYFK